MTRTETDLRAALRQLEQLADEHGAPSTTTLLSPPTADRLGPHRVAGSRRYPRWLAPLAAAAAVAAAAITAVSLSGQPGALPPSPAHQAGNGPTASHSAPPHHTAPSSSATAQHNGTASAASILDDAAAALDATPTWTPPKPQDFFYVRTTQAMTWTSVSGEQPGEGRSPDGTKIWVPGCANGHIVSPGESGSCTVDQVPHYLADAPSTPAQWDGYLERLAPGAKASGAQGKFIVQVLHQDLVAPKAVAALLRYTASCPGLRTISVQPVAGEQLIGVTCTGMINGSYGLAFDADSHHLVGFVGVSQDGQQNGPAEIVQQTGIVSAIGRTP